MKHSEVCVVNAYGITVKKMCASCAMKEVENDGERVCQKMGLKVKQQFCCRHWQMSDGLNDDKLIRQIVVSGQNRNCIIINESEGELHTRTYLVWTEKGRKFIHRMCKTEEIMIPFLLSVEVTNQRHYFGAMAENYFDNKLKDASVNVQRKQKTYEAFDRLPEEFTIEDVVRCFNLGSSASARKKVTRLCRDHLIEKISEEKSGQKALFQKTGNIML